jgi:hypothetical protein
MEEDTQKQHKKQYDWLKQYQFQKGQSGNPGGAKKGKRLKTFALELLENMDEEAKANFLKEIEPRIVWEMAEGKAEAKTDITSKGESIQQVLVKFIDAEPNQDNRNPEGV